MTKRRQVGILGAALLFGVSTTRVSSAQEQGTGPVGRQVQGAQAWTNYWFTPRNRLQINFRHQKASQEFIPGGGTLTDVGVRGDYWLRSNLGLSGWVQHERWLFPVIQPTVSRNVTAAVQILFEPQKLFRHSAASATGTE